MYLILCRIVFCYYLHICVNKDRHQFIFNVSGARPNCGVYETADVWMHNIG